MYTAYGESADVLEPDMNDPFNWRTQEQLQTAFRPYDFEHSGVISTAHCRLALKQCYGFITKDLESLINQMETENWEGERSINFKALIFKIARDPPGYVRTTIALPKIEHVEPAPQML
ncbi:MAG: hypothetical protein ACK55Z_15250 [bacterium]|jgi:hypothetical protein